MSAQAHTEGESPANEMRAEPFYLHGTLSAYEVEEIPPQKAVQLLAQVSRRRTDSRRREDDRAYV